MKAIKYHFSLIRHGKVERWVMMSVGKNTEVSKIENHAKG